MNISTYRYSLIFGQPEYVDILVDLAYFHFIFCSLKHTINVWLITPHNTKHGCKFIGRISLQVCCFFIKLDQNHLVGRSVCACGLEQRDSRCLKGEAAMTAPVCSQLQAGHSALVVQARGPVVIRQSAGSEPRTFNIWVPHAGVVTTWATSYSCSQQHGQYYFHSFTVSHL